MPLPMLRRASLYLPLFSVAVSTIAARAQTVTPSRAFEVVSIRQNVSQNHGQPRLAPTPDGFRVEGVSLWMLMLTAYTPKSSSASLFTNNIENLPPWAKSDSYDIDARISDNDRAAWQDPKNQPAMLQEMLQGTLSDRFRLAVHRSSKEVSAFDLVVAKGGPNFKETKPDELRPAGTVLPGDGVMVPTQTAAGRGANFYNMPMSLLASMLADAAEHEIRDKTGLTGRYDFFIRKPASLKAPSAAPDANQTPDTDPSVFDVAGGLGLKLVPAKEQVETLVIDHVERPSVN